MKCLTNHIPSICMLGFALTISGCSTEHIKEYQAIYWPKPPDTPRFVYEGTFRSGEDLVAFTGKAGFKNAITGIAPDKTMAFKKPYDVAARGGRIVISDTISHLATI